MAKHQERLKVKFEGRGDAPSLKSDVGENRPITPEDVSPQLEKGDAQVLRIDQRLLFGDDFVQIFSTVVSGQQLNQQFPKMQLEGMLENRKGILPMTLIQDEEIRNEYHEREWVKKVFFRLTSAGCETEEPNYLARFYINKTEDASYCTQDRNAEYIREPDFDRQPPIRSHARGLISRHRMDVIDGIQFLKPVAPTMDLWLLPDEGVNKKELEHGMRLRVDTQLETDCLDALYGSIIEKAAVSSSLNDMPTEECLSVKSEASKEQLEVAEAPTQTMDTSSGKKSLKLRCRKLLRRLFGCVLQRNSDTQ